MQETHLSPSRLTASIVFFLGFATFLPVGSTYLALIALLPLATVRFREGWRQINRLWIMALSLLLIWPLTSLVFSHNDHFTDRYLHSIRLAICLTIALVLSKDEQRLLMRGFLWGSAAAIAVVVTHHLLRPLPDWAVWRQLLSVTGNGSSQKWIMLATVPISALLLVLDHKTIRAQCVLMMLAIAAVVVVSAFSISRNAYLVAIASVFFAVIYRYRSSKAWLAGLALMVIFAVAGYISSETVQYRIVLASEELESFFTLGRFDSSIGVRAMMYWTALQTMQEHWFLGSGLGSWQAIWQVVSVPFPSQAGLNNPHNDFLLWGMETGVLGLLTLVFICFLALRTSWVHNNPIAAIGWLMTWSLVLTALVNAPFRDGALGMSMTVLAVALSHYKTVEKPHGRVA